MSRKYALFVGNCDYDSESLSNLESPISDVQDLANLFRDTSIGGFDDVVELINSTESKIRQLISSFFLHKKPEDLLLLYFSGHGILDDKGDLYLAAKDTQPDLLRATAISADFIADDMDRCRSKRQILILDCCHSGAFRRGIKGDDKVLTASTFEGNGSGRIVLTASDRREFAMEGNQVLKNIKTSLFTHFLLEGLKSGDADKDGDSLISLDEWYDYAYDKVVENLSTQTPRRWVYNQEGRLIIARNPKPIKPAELAWELREAIKDDRPSVRLGAISELAHILNSPNKRLTLAARNALLNLLKDDSPEVRETADRILAGNDSVNLRKSSKTKDPVQDSLAGLMSIWANLLSVLRIRTVGQWRSWMIAFVIVVAVGLAGGGLVILTDTNSANGGVENSLTEQADMGTLGILDTSLVESDQNEDIQESSTSTVNQPPDTQEAAGQQTPSSSSNEESPAEGEFTQPQENLTSPDEQRLMEKGEPTVTYSESEIERDEQLNPLLAVQPDEEKIAGAEEDPASNAELPLERVQSEIIDLQRSLSQAIKNQQWANVPDPFVNYYYINRIETLYSKFNILDVESSTGDLQSDEATATLHVTLNISYQQKGREDLQNLQIPANWVWIKGDVGFMLSEVRRP